MTHRASLGLAAFLGASSLAACSTTTGTNGISGGTASATAPIAAQAAVLENVFGANVSGLKDQSPTYCVKAGGEDGRPDQTQAVVAELRNNPKVKPASACEVAGNGGGVFDRQLRQRALMFTVTTDRCLSATECLIRGGYYEGNMSAQTNVYRARLVDGRWNVTLEEMGPVA